MDTPVYTKHLLEMVERIAGIGSWRIDLVKGQVFWSDHVYTIHGVTKDTYTPELESAIDFYHPEDAPMVQEVVNKAISNKENFEFQLRIIRADGIIRWVHSKGECELDREGKVAAINGIFQDITEQKDIQLKLQESEERFSLAIQGSKSGVWDWININEEPEWWSPQFYHLLGYNDQEIPATATNFTKALHPDDTVRTFAMVQDHFAGKGDFDLEYRLRAKSGEYRWFHGRGVASRDKQGNPIRMVGSITDIHEQKKSMQQLDAYFELSIDLLCIATATHFLRINPSFPKTLGYSQEELLSRPFLDFIHPDDRDITGEEVEHLATGRVTLNFKNRYRHKKGHYLWLSWQAAYDPEENLLYCAARDITEQQHKDQLIRQYNRQLQIRNKELDDFAYSASHDLKAPLRAIDNLSNWIAQDASDVLPEESQKHIKQLRQRVNRMERLLDDLLQYSRVGRIESDVVTVEPGELLNEVVSNLSVPAGFKVQFQDGFPTLYTQRVPLYQIFLNLIDNAIKHHDKDQGTVEVRYRVEEDMAFFSISDDGPGIDPDFHERIFQIFQTLKPRDEVEGSGMGLAIVEKIIRNYGGTITLSSIPGEGSTFEFSWPIDARKGINPM